jgi:iron complex outermembrane receptor protein
VAAVTSRAAAQTVAQLQNLSIDELANIQITSVSKKGQPLSDAAAAIYVITHDDIVRSGARSVPEILRLAPNLEVAQVSPSSYAISARGFNGTTTSNGAGNKLLVLVDGRSVYTPLYAGVFWDLQFVLPEDIDRIEVISGPGAALWGANAVNGVINIITRNSTDTQGNTVRVYAGNLDLGGSAQYGGKIGDATTLRIYGAGFHEGPDVTPSGLSADDGWHKFQGGFRVDWAPDNAQVTVQGDIFTGREDAAMGPSAVLDGHNLLARWNQGLDGGATLQVQAYYDYNTLYVPGSLGDSLSTFDFDAQHSFSWGTAQNIVWGGGVRLMQDEFTNTPSVKFLPPKTTQTLSNGFVQDTISLSESFKLIVGTKLEGDPFVGLQVLPNGRLSWKVSDSDLLWVAVSRAVRAPSLWDRDLNELAGSFTILSGGDFQSEKLLAYEAGYRTEPLANLSFSVSTYYNDYNDLRSVEFSPGPAFPLIYGNEMKGTSYGVETWGTYGVFDWWRLSAGFNFEQKDLWFERGSSRLLGTQAAGDDPTYQASLRSSMDLPHDLKLDIALRNIAALPDPAVPAYVELDARIAWNVWNGVELSVTGSNLLQDRHPEFATTAGTNEVPRSFIASVGWAF